MNISINLKVYIILKKLYDLTIHRNYLYGFCYHIKTYQFQSPFSCSMQTSYVISAGIYLMHPIKGMTAKSKVSKSIVSLSFIRLAVISAMHGIINMT